MTLFHFSFYLQPLNHQDLFSSLNQISATRAGMADPVDCNECRSTFVSFKQYINHLLSKACAAAKKEVFLIRFCSVDKSRHPLVFDVNSLMVLVIYWMNAKLSLIG